MCTVCMYIVQYHRAWSQTSCCMSHQGSRILLCIIERGVRLPFACTSMSQSKLLKLQSVGVIQYIRRRSLLHDKGVLAALFLLAFITQNCYTYLYTNQYAVGRVEENITRQMKNPTGGGRKTRKKRRSSWFQRSQ